MASYRVTFGASFVAPYGASKAGMSALSQSLAKELAPFKIYVTAVAPGWVEGGMVPTAEAQRLIARYLYAHYGREVLIADVGATSTSLFLANGEHDQATGAVFGHELPDRRYRAGVETVDPRTITRVSSGSSALKLA